MGLQGRHELEVTRRKLRLLEERLTAARTEPRDTPRGHELSLRSLTRMINQLKEAIARFEAHAIEKSSTRQGCLGLAAKSTDMTGPLARMPACPSRVADTLRSSLKRGG
jgi:hypothetical protein